MVMPSEDQVLEFVKRELTAVVPGLSLRTGSASMRRDRTAEDVVRDDLRERADEQRQGRDPELPPERVQRRAVDRSESRDLRDGRRLREPPA